MERREVLLDALAAAIEARNDAQLAALLDPRRDAAFCARHAADLTLPAALAGAAPAPAITGAIDGVAPPPDQARLIASRLGRGTGPAPAPKLPDDWQELGRWCAGACSLAVADGDLELIALSRDRATDLWRAATLALMQGHREQTARLLRWLAFAPPRDPDHFVAALDAIGGASDAETRYHARVAAAQRRAP